jgi:hypothetical protein
VRVGRGQCRPWGAEAGTRDASRGPLSPRRAPMTRPLGPLAALVRRGGWSRCSDRRQGSLATGAAGDDERSGTRHPHQPDGGRPAAPGAPRCALESSAPGRRARRRWGLSRGSGCAGAARHAAHLGCRRAAGPSAGMAAVSGAPGEPAAASSAWRGPPRPMGLEASHPPDAAPLAAPSPRGGGLPLGRPSAGPAPAPARATASRAPRPGAGRRCGAPQRAGPGGQQLGAGCSAPTPWSPPACARRRPRRATAGSLTVRRPGGGWAVRAARDPGRPWQGASPALQRPPGGACGGGAAVPQARRGRPGSWWCRAEAARAPARRVSGPSRGSTRPTARARAPGGAWAAAARAAPRGGRTCGPAVCRGRAGQPPGGARTGAARGRGLTPGTTGARSVCTGAPGAPPRVDVPGA